MDWVTWLVIKASLVSTYVDICLYINCTELSCHVASHPLASLHPLFGLLGLSVSFDDQDKLNHFQVL